MSLDSLPTIVSMILKISVLVGLALYSLFAGVMVRQHQLMDKVIDETFEPILKLVVILHFAFAVGLLIFSFFTL